MHSPAALSAMTFDAFLHEYGGVGPLMGNCVPVAYAVRAAVRAFHGEASCRAVWGTVQDASGTVGPHAWIVTVGGLVLDPLGEAWPSPVVSRTVLEPYADDALDAKMVELKAMDALL